MAEGPRVSCNRRVHAEVRVTDPVADTEHVEEGFRAEQWSFEALSPDRYLVSVPVYSAWFAAMDVARAKILDFSDQVADVEIVFLRTQSRRAREGFMYRSMRVRKKVSKGVPKSWVTPPPRFGVGPGRDAWPAWELHSPYTLRDHYLDYLEGRFTENYAGGELELRQMSSPPTASTLEQERTRLLAVLSSDRALTILIAIGILMLSVVASELPGSAARGVSAAIGLAVALTVGFVLAGNVTGWVSKAVSIATPVVLFTAGGMLFWIAQLSSGRDPMVLIAIIVSVVVVARGLMHLLKIRPRVRVLASISVLTALVAISFGGARVFVSAVAGDSGVSLSNAAVPAWLMPIAGVFLFGCLLCGAIVAGSAWGWFEYAGGSTTFRKTPEVLASLLALLVVFIGSMVVLAAMSTAESYYRSWLDEFAEQRTPQITSDFVYRACLFDESGVGSEDNLGSIPAAFSQPIVVIEGDGGPQWIWEPEAASKSSSMNATRIDAEKYEVVEVGDGVTTCAEPSP